MVTDAAPASAGMWIRSDGINSNGSEYLSRVTTASTAWFTLNGPGVPVSPDTDKCTGMDRLFRTQNPPLFTHASRAGVAGNQAA